MSDELADITERLRRAAPFMRATVNAGLFGQHADTCEEAAAVIDRAKRAFKSLIAAIEREGFEVLSDVQGETYSVRPRER